MGSKSNKRKKYYCNSSSGSDADPDYTARLSKKPSMENTFSSLTGGLRKNIKEVKGLKISPGTSTMRVTQHKFPPKKKNSIEQGDVAMRRIKAGRKRELISRRKRKSEDETDNKQTGFCVCRRYRRSRIDQSDFENKGYSSKRNSEDGNGQMKMKGTIFSWLLDNNTIQEDANVFLATDHNNNTPLKKGLLKRQGILCFCCNKIFTAAGFNFHGGRKNNKPYESIFIDKKRVSLLYCMIQAWNKPEESERQRFNRIETKAGNAGDFHDDACMICADGGNLMCCEECNSTYHQSCMAMEEVPVGSWYCPYCVCKFCGDPVHQNDYLLECPQCEKKYHWECHQKREFTGIDMNRIPCAPFCGGSCKEVREKLERNIVGKKNELDEGFSWTLLHRMDDDNGIFLDDTYQRTLCHSKLAVAQRLMEDCFEPIVDRHTRINVIPSVVYNSGANFNRIQFRGFYTAVLEKDEEIITAASLRIHGTKLAEMPFIATRNIHRCKGMCKKLMVAIESALCYLNVEYLVIPSVSERIGNWIDKYGFGILEAKMEKEIMCHNTLMFHDSIRLQKSLVPSYLAESGCRNSGGTLMRKAGNNNPQNCPSFRKKDTRMSILDLNLEPRKSNRHSWMNNYNKMTYKLN